MPPAASTAGSGHSWSDGSPRCDGKVHLGGRWSRFPSLTGFIWLLSATFSIKTWYCRVSIHLVVFSKLRNFSLTVCRCWLLTPIIQVAHISSLFICRDACLVPRKGSQAVCCQHPSDKHARHRSRHRSVHQVGSLKPGSARSAYSNSGWSSLHPTALPLLRPITFHQAGSRMWDKRHEGILSHTHTHCADTKKTDMLFSHSWRTYMR